MAYRSSSLGTPANNTTHTVAVPGSLTNGDKVLIYFIEDLSTTSPSGVPSGFTVHATSSSTASTWRSMSVRMWWKDITDAGSEGSGGNYTMTFGSAAIGYMIAVAFSGRGTGAPTVTATDDGAAAASPLSVALSGVTAATADDIAWLGVLAPMDDGDMYSMTSTFAPPTNYTERQELGGLWRISELATRDNVSSGATGTITGTATFTEVATSRFTGLVATMAASGGGGGSTGSKLLLLGVG